ncbi:MAG: hypothetical protein QOK36_868, partial [Gaiellales bacterium]|nr:hypothetical protein [Gaiellales bacterium]
RRGVAVERPGADVEALACTLDTAVILDRPDERSWAMRHEKQRSGKTRAGTRLVALAAVALASSGVAVGSASASAAKRSVQLAPVRQVPVCTATFGGGLKKSARRVSIAGPAVANISPFATVGIGGHSL